MNLAAFARSANWQIVHRATIPGREGTYANWQELDLTTATCKYLSQFSSGVYQHQLDAIGRATHGSNVCLATSTASGKSLVFYTSAIEMLARDQCARVIAVYPLKALGTEQEARWKTAFRNAGLHQNVGRIDGGTPMNDRLGILRACSVVIMTPDIMHAWMLLNIGAKIVADFLRNTHLVILDEAHTYTGVFGSNSAFLLRRLRHLLAKLGGRPQFIAASATMSSPDVHLKKLAGVDFEVVGPESDTSPRKPSSLYLLDPPSTSDMLSSIADLFKFCAASNNDQFVAFVDSRKQTEYLASICTRQGDSDTGEEPATKLDFETFDKLQICPYRAGYEESDRAEIQRRLTQGELRGVVSTSALEMGIDIPGLTIGILLGVPPSATSLFQRIGRIGRHNEGTILIVNNGTIATRAIFRKPDDLLNIPLAESALYLENPRIQYIHALCLARQGGEDESVSSPADAADHQFSSPIDFPPGFVDICNAERIGELPAELQSMKAQAGEDPNHIYPLRDVDIQFRVESRGCDTRRLGSLTHAQLMREAYPGAVYYYQAMPYRVFRVNRTSHVVEVRKERRYTTKPKTLPVMIFPNLSVDNVYSGLAFGGLTVVECNLQVWQAIIGFEERRGSNKMQVSYPLEPTLGLYFDQPKFQRTVFTSGVLFGYPDFEAKSVKTDLLALIIYEAFLMTVPFERQDVSFGDDKHRADRDGFKKGDHFISIFDQTYGSLRLTSRLTEQHTLVQVLEQAIEIARDESAFEMNPSTLDALKGLRAAADQTPLPIRGKQVSNATVTAGETVILPGSKGVDTKRDNEEFFVENVFFSPQSQCIAYHGKHYSEQTKKFEKCLVSVPAHNVVEIPGVSKTGYYSYETGHIETAERDVEITSAKEKKEEGQRPPWKE